MFYYDAEIVVHGGRLLLRGNNGTGKSKVLALTLPRKIAPHRVEPDGDRQKKMEWNLLSVADIPIRSASGTRGSNSAAAPRRDHRVPHRRMRAESCRPARGVSRRWISSRHSASARTCNCCPPAGFR